MTSTPALPDPARVLPGGPESAPKQGLKPLQILDLSGYLLYFEAIAIFPALPRFFATSWVGLGAPRLVQVGFQRGAAPFRFNLDS